MGEVRLKKRIRFKRNPRLISTDFIRSFIGDFPDIKDDDVIDIYVYKNGVLVWPKK